jgi:hypothetical protein
MKTGILLPLLFISTATLAQRSLNQVVAVAQGQRIEMHFDYPNLIRVTTWDKNEISIRGSVSINGGENDDAFVLSTSSTPGVVTVKSEIVNMKSLPNRITVHQGSEKITFRNEAEFEKYRQQQTRAIDRKHEGVEMKIELEIKVPRNVETFIKSTYGMVEVKDFAGPINVEATYGGVDVSINEKLTGELIAQTNYGEILTNLDSRFESNKGDDFFYTHVFTKPGSGPRYYVESKYGKIYLRKRN